MGCKMGISFFCFLTVFYMVSAHSESERRQLVDSKVFHERSKRSLSHCQNTREARSIREETAFRRESLYHSLRQERQTSNSWANTVLNTNHQSRRTDLRPNSNPFTGSTASCILSPEAEVGPYWVKGELIRSDLRENQPGVDLYLDIQVIDVNTCRPVTNIYLDIWSCNASGVYAGVSGPGNGNPNDPSIINATYSRGVQPTNSNGYATYITKFPGHYDGRTTHIHVIGHMNGAVLPNGTYSGGTIAHIGQMYFDQQLINSVESTSPYNMNTNPMTPNSEDTVIVDQQSTTPGSDPFVNYVLLGPTVQSGIFAWVTVAVDTRADHTGESSVATLWTANGGVPQNNGFPNFDPRGFGGFGFDGFGGFSGGNMPPPPFRGSFQFNGNFGPPPPVNG